jgi:hypothetical protein
MSIGTRLLQAVLVTTAAASAVTLSARDFHITQGRLLAVDTDAQRLIVRTGQGAEQYTFTEDTQVVGAADDIADLTALSPLTVHYDEAPMARVATLIEVHPAF